MNQLFSHPAPAVTWRHLRLVLLIGFAARVAMALTTDRTIHPDQVFQYLEQGFRLSHGYGLVPWEYVYGIRSWLIPGVIAGVLKFAQMVGLDQPRYYIPMVKIAFCIVSMGLPLAIYRFAQMLTTERAAVVALILGCFWPYFIYFAATPMTTMLAAHALMWMCVLILRQPGAGRLVLFGALAGLTLAIRFQLLPVAGVLCLFAMVALPRRIGWALLGFITVVVAVGLLDLVTWGGFLSSFIDNFYYNLIDGISERHGVYGPLFFIRLGYLETGALIFAMVAGMILLARRAWPVWLAVAVGIVAMHLPAHKEFRFIVWIMPFGVVGLAHLIYWLSDRLQPYRTLRLAVIGFIWFWFAATSVIYTLFQYDLFEPRPRTHELARLVRITSEDPDLTGLAIQTPRGHWWSTGGWYALGRPVPIYFPGWHGAQDLATSGIDFSVVSHIIAGDAPVPEGYEPIARTVSLTLWKSRLATRPYGDAPFDFRAPSGTPPDAFSKPPRGIVYPPMATRFP